MRSSGTWSAEQGSGHRPPIVSGTECSDVDLEAAASAGREYGAIKVAPTRLESDGNKKGLKWLMADISLVARLLWWLTIELVVFLFNALF